jgi:hypothetical protein
MNTEVAVGDLRAVADIEWIWAEAERFARRGSKQKRTTEDTGKRRGEMAEAAFMAKVSSLRFGVAKPWGDSDRYDFIVDGDAGLWRVEVKSAHRAGEDGGYSFHAHGHSLSPYRADEIDALVAYVVPEDAWYVFPVKVFGRIRSVKLFPGSSRKEIEV